MPPARTLQASKYPNSKLERSVAKGKAGMVPVGVATEGEIVDLADCIRYFTNYPLDSNVRQTFKTKDGKRLTAHQWAVYDYVRKIPAGRVTTYKDICVALGQGSPRSVGAALRNNPFAPFVACHRVIASNHYIGGFYGEWGQNAGTGTQYHRKIDMLAKEGIAFNDKGYLVGGDTAIWK